MKKIISPNGQIKYKVSVQDFNLEKEFMKDCPNYSELPTIIPEKKRIIVIGDVHGDLKLSVESFKLAGLINDDHEWIADPPDTVVVQVGDQIDSCRFYKGELDCHNKRANDDVAEDIKVMEFFDEMHEKALMKGGAVYSLIGNHELMNSQGQFNYVSFDNFDKFQYGDFIGKNGRKEAFAPGGIVANKMACTRQSVIVIGSNMFVHAGILPRFARDLDYLGIDDKSKLKHLNSIVRKWLLNKVIPNQDLQLITNIESSPFWTRIYGNIPQNRPFNSPECEQSIKEVMSTFKIGKIVVGHTPQLSQNRISGTCNLPDGTSTVYRVDGGFSRGFKSFSNDNTIQVLEIMNDSEFRIVTN